MATRSDKLPALQVYGGDWRKDPGIQSLDYFSRGVWWEMLLIMHECSERGVLLLGNKPMTEAALAQLLGITKKRLRIVLDKLFAYGVAHKRETDEAIYSKRMVRDEEIRQTRKAAGSLGGNPNLLNQPVKQEVNTKPTTQVKQKSTPSSSSSSSSSSSDLNTPPTPLKGEAASAATPPLSLLSNGVHKPKKKKPVFDPTGKTKFLDWVYLDENQLARLEKYYKSHGLEPEDLQLAIKFLDAWYHDNPAKRLTRTDDARTLTDWPLEKALKHRREIRATQRQKEIYQRN